ncbi:MAG: hypothetical protein IJG23_07110 [Clostridia bacterium]|nr:hypothetical protein [Clostridia bacterium]
MVFKKIEDENAKYGVRLQNRPLDFIKGIRNETGSTQFNDGFKESLQQDEQALWAIMCSVIVEH